MSELRWNFDRCFLEKPKLKESDDSSHSGELPITAKLKRTIIFCRLKARLHALAIIAAISSAIFFF
jgi:hypothetical protein